MEKNRILSTDELFQKAATGQEIDFKAFTNLEKEKGLLQEDIEKQFPSIKQFAEQCYMNHSHIYEFLHKDKKIGCDRMTAMFIVLGYNVFKIKSLLERFQVGTLYINKRNCLIIQALREADQQGLTHRQRLDHVETKLIEQKEKTLIKS